MVDFFYILRKVIHENGEFLKKINMTEIRFCSIFNAYKILVLVFYYTSKKEFAIKKIIFSLFQEAF